MTRPAMPSSCSNRSATGSSPGGRPDALAGCGDDHRRRRSPSRLARRLTTRDAVVIGLGSMIGAGSSPRSPRPPRRPVPGCCSAWRSPRSSPTATRPPRHGSPPATRPPAAPTSTAVNGSATSGATWPAGLSSSARPPPARRWPSPSAPTRRPARPARRRRRGRRADRRELRRRAQVRWLPGDRRPSSSPCSPPSSPPASSVATPSVDHIGAPAAGVTGVLQAAGLLFFAFAGYARIATLGEEVRDPARTIPRAIPFALGITLAVYAARRVRHPARRRTRSARRARPAALHRRTGRQPRRWRRRCASARRSRRSVRCSP